MRCQEFTELAERYWDRDLDPEDRFLVQYHARRCYTCSVHFQEGQTLCRALDSMPQDPAPVGFEQRVLGCVDVNRFVPRKAVLGPMQRGLAATLPLSLLFVVAGRMGEYGSQALGILGETATWTYGWASVPISEISLRLVGESWPMLHHTLGTLANAALLFAGEQGVSYGSKLGLLAGLACSAAVVGARLVRGGRHVPLRIP